MPTLPLTPIVTVNYSLTGTTTARRGFNLGLIIGTSTVVTANQRVALYNSLADMVTAGFSTSSPEYLAAQQYFAAPSNPSQVAIGRQDLSASETCLAALQACRAANNDWYIAYVPGAASSDHTAIAAYIEALTAPYSQYFLQSSLSAILNATAGNLFETLKGSNYSRTLGLYSSSAHAVAGLMGYAMGQTSDFAGSAYTLAFKTLPGATPEVLTTQQVANIEGNNGNVYVTRGGAYNIVEKGNMFSGSWFDEIIYRDKLINEIQLNLMDALYNSPKIAQTETGMGTLRATVAQACEKLRQIGFIAPGQWNGPSILTLQNGDTLPDGYRVMSDSIASQSSTDRGNRIAPNIYVAIKLAGAIQSVLINVNVNR